jgi:hypothetical protein
LEAASAGKRRVILGKLIILASGGDRSIGGDREMQGIFSGVRSKLAKWMRASWKKWLSWRRRG